MKALKSDNSPFQKIEILFNFSASPIGGGLKRLVETAKIFANEKKAHFLIHPLALGSVEKILAPEAYSVIRIHKLSRLVSDGSYLKMILRDLGQPKLYFSYGIPLPFKVGEKNWVHISNAMTVLNGKISIAYFRKAEMLLLRRRMKSSIRHADFCSAESQFILNVLKSENKSANLKTVFQVLENGVDRELFRHWKDKEPRPSQKNHVKMISIGTYSYKRLDRVLKIYQDLKKNSDKNWVLEIIGDTEPLDKELLNVPDVVISGKLTRTEVYEALLNADIFISMSEIENSPNAALEGLLLVSDSVILSNIGPHRELLERSNLEAVLSSDSSYLTASAVSVKAKLPLLTWDEAIKPISEQLFKVNRS